MDTISQKGNQSCLCGLLLVFAGQAVQIGTRPSYKRGDRTEQSSKANIKGTKIQATDTLVLVKFLKVMVPTYL